MCHVYIADHLLHYKANSNQIRTFGNLILWMTFHFGHLNTFYQNEMLNVSKLKRNIPELKCLKKVNTFIFMNHKF